MEMDEIQFPKFLADIAILQARHETLMACFLNYVEKKDPSDFEPIKTAYETQAKQLGLKYIYSIPQIDQALRDKLKLELGL